MLLLVPICQGPPSYLLSMEGKGEWSKHMVVGAYTPVGQTRLFKGLDVEGDSTSQVEYQKGLP